MNESIINQGGKNLSARLTLPDKRTYVIQARTALLVGDQVEPERSENEQGAFLYEKGQRPDMTFVVYILNKIVLEKLAQEFSKPISGFHIHDNVNTEGSVVCWPGEIETAEEAKRVLKQWLGLIGALTNSMESDINKLYDPNDPDWLDNVPKKAGVKIIIEEEQEGGSWRDGPSDPISFELSDASDSNPHKLETVDELIGAARGVVNFLPENPSILYIASGTDISLESVFPKKSITYLDPDMSVANKLCEDSERNVIPEGIPTSTYNGKHDLIVLMNKNGDFGPTDILPHLNNGGSILAQGNGWNFDAEQFLLSDQFTLTGVMDSEGEQFKTEKLEEYKIVSKAKNSSIEKTEFERMGKWYIFQKK